MMHELGRMLVVLGVTIVIVGALLMLAGKTGLLIGRLPGDFVWRGKDSVVYFPLATSILISVVLSLLLYFINRFRH